MNRRMLLIAAVLIVLVVVFANPFKDQLKREKRDLVAVFDKQKIETADHIEVATAADSSVVVRQDGKWVVGSQNAFPADTAAVGNLLRALENARSAGVVSNNPENRSRFQVDATGVRVKVLAQNAVVAQSAVEAQSVPADPERTVRDAQAEFDLLIKAVLAEQEQLDKSLQSLIVSERKERVERRTEELAPH